MFHFEAVPRKWSGFKTQKMVFEISAASHKGITGRKLVLPLLFTKGARKLDKIFTTKLDLEKVRYSQEDIPRWSFFEACWLREGLWIGPCGGVWGAMIGLNPQMSLPVNSLIARVLWIRSRRTERQALTRIKAKADRHRRFRTAIPLRKGTDT